MGQARGEISGANPELTERFPADLQNQQVTGRLDRRFGRCQHAQPSRNEQKHRTQATQQGCQDKALNQG